MEQQRICKKCLLRDLAAEDQKNIGKYIGAIKPQDRTDGEAYEERLAVCMKCEKLVEATCQAWLLCGAACSNPAWQMSVSKVEPLTISRSYNGC